MSAIFGFEGQADQSFISKGVVCLPYTSDGKLDIHNTVASIRNEDIVFVKHCTLQSSLQIRAVGVVQSDYPVSTDSGYCLPVNWVWLGKKEIDHFDENLPLSDSALYEEHDVLVQREIIQLLPEKYRLPQEW